MCAGRSLLLVAATALTTASVALPIATSKGSSDPKAPEACDGRKSEKACEETDDQGRSTSSCRWDYLHKDCHEMDCHKYDSDEHQCTRVSFCIKGESQKKQVCFNDDCHFYNPNSADKLAFYSGEESTRKQICDDASHCKMAEIERNGKPSWSCSWKQCKTYNHQLNAKEQCEQTTHCMYNGKSCVNKPEAE